MKRCLAISRDILFLSCFLFGFIKAEGDLTEVINVQENADEIEVVVLEAAVPSATDSESDSLSDISMDALNALPSENPSLSFTKLTEGLSWSECAEIGWGVFRDHLSRNKCKYYIAAAAVTVGSGALIVYLLSKNKAVTPTN